MGLRDQHLGIDGELAVRALDKGRAQPQIGAMRLLLVLLTLVPVTALAQPAAEPPVPPSSAVEALPPSPPAATEYGPPEGVDVEAVLRGEGRGLSADAAARIAIETAPGVDRARAAQRQAAAGASRALNGFIPQLTISFRYTRLSDIQNGTFGGGQTVDPALIPMITAGVDDPDARRLWDQTLRAQAAQANYTFPIFLDQFAFRGTLVYPVSSVLASILPTYESARANEAAAEARVAAQRREVGLSARETFYQYARARGALAVAQSSLQQAESRYAQAQAFVEAGTSAPIDALRARAQVAAAQVAVVRAEAGVRIGGVALRTLMHLEPGTPIAVGEDLLGPLAPIDGDEARLLERALARRDDVAAVERLIEAAGHSVDAAEGSRYPTVALQANLDYSNPNPRVFPQTDEFRESWDISAVLSWSPHDLLNGEAQADEARAQRDQVRADLRQLRDAVRLAVTDASATYRAALQALDAARLGVEAADESYRVMMERYRAGAATASDTIDASAEQVRAQLDLVNAAIDARIAHARLRRAIGASER